MRRLVPRLFFASAALLWAALAGVAESDIPPAQPFVVRVVFGYKDARPARFVADRYEEMLLIQRLTRPCQVRRGDEGGREDCGFERLPDSAASGAALLRRRLDGTADRPPRTIWLSVIHSSTSPDDAANRRDPFQRWQSRQASRWFLDGFSKADVVLYNGHSRAGGGPDFTPPRTDSLGHVEYDWYQRRRPGLRSMERALRRKDAARTRKLGLYSCASEEHFAARIRTARKGLALITSPKAIYFADALRLTLDAVSDAVHHLARPEELAPRSASD